MTSNAATQALPVPPVEPENAVGAEPGAALAHHVVGDGANGEVAADAIARPWRTPRVRSADIVARQLSLSRRLSPAQARAMVVVGRFGAVLLPVAVVLATATSLHASARLAGGLLLAAIWFGALESAFAAARLSPLALGVPVATAIATLMAVPAISLVAFAVPALDRLRPIDVFAMVAGVFVVSASFEAVVKRTLGLRRRVLVVGASNGAADLVEELETRGGGPFDCVGVIDDERPAVSAAARPLLGPFDRLGEIVAREKPDIIVLASPHARADTFDQLLDVAGLDFRVVGAAEFYEHAFGRVPVRHLSPVWFMSVLHLYQRRYSRLTKRALDIAVATVGLVLSLPLFLVVALLVRASSGGPALYRQVRLGEGGKTFEMLKFRTMVDGAEEPGEAIWAEERDARITWIGRYLRRSRIDELPQLWNVLRNEMSVIGPRPERPEFLEVLQREVPFWTRRHLVKPGVTGWAQVSRGYTSDSDGTAEKLSYDLYYLKHRSLALDLAIVAKTVRVLFSGTGAR